MERSFFTSERYRKLINEFEAKLNRTLTTEEKQVIKAIVLQELKNKED